MNSTSTISGNETVVRILHRDWIVDDELQISAFSLRQNETYISVNRPIIESFNDDISDFLSKHTEYLISDEPKAYKRAAMNVEELRSINVLLGQNNLDVAVEVEPRDSHYKSHSGIFTRLSGENIKGGQQKDVLIDEETTLPISAIYQKVQHKLLSIATLEQHIIEEL
ncbi:MAG: hypothetical protein J5953_03340 [Prevotella sp.]|nr:hypothetical protein [Prevotella sp.]